MTDCHEIPSPKANEVLKSKTPNCGEGKVCGRAQDQPTFDDIAPVLDFESQGTHAQTGRESTRPLNHGSDWPHITFHPLPGPEILRVSGATRS
ncbi:hypothetical protein J7T55_010031 [Diaporthe amygdali]|uniref:uncharacterized protein n=1 Tax=Phomopsis amygdali TaxID=1214568 RepID=UPI0022FE25AB|nr:uncharacterized protein J7T55_010031 [Diaporthe amygdali]KAJ0116880.1 hypothetical protein J7T55_010031 [Diaporthe amygdali]